MATRGRLSVLAIAAAAAALAAGYVSAAGKISESVSGPSRMFEFSNMPMLGELRASQSGAGSYREQCQTLLAGARNNAAIGAGMHTYRLPLLRTDKPAIPDLVERGCRPEGSRRLMI